MKFKKEIVHLPYFLPLDDFSVQYEWKDNNITYFGRLSEEKGLSPLIESLKGINIQLNIVGDGPIREKLELKVKDLHLKNVHFVGYKTGEQLKDLIKNSMFIVVPSQWYENYPFAILESFAYGKPVVGSRIGGIPELVKDHVTGQQYHAPCRL